MFRPICLDCTTRAALNSKLTDCGAPRALLMEERLAKMKRDGSQTRWILQAAHCSYLGSHKPVTEQFIKWSHTQVLSFHSRLRLTN